MLLAPLQIGLAVQLHHHYASHFLVDSLHPLGFCCSYQQVQEFERSATFSHGTDIPNFSDQSVQYVADNMDHNIRTLDGNDTFHWMGMITTVTPRVRSNNLIPRIKVSLRDLAATGRVAIELGPDICSTILFLHAILGCDTTSQLHGITIFYVFPSSDYSGLLVCYRAHFSLKRLQSLL